MKSEYWLIDILPGLMLLERKLLKAQGIENTQELLKRTRTPAARLALAGKLRLSQKDLSKWIALADLGRIPSVGSQYCGLILHAGIISVAQLAQTPFPRLHARIARLQVATLQRKDLTPSIGLVKQWVEQAKMLSRNS